MPEATTEKLIISMIAETVGAKAEEVTRETRFVDDLGFDSLDAIEIIMDFEDVLNVQIPDGDAEKIETVGQAIDYIVEQNKENQC